MEALKSMAENLYRTLVIPYVPKIFKKWCAFEICDQLATNQQCICSNKIFCNRFLFIFYRVFHVIWCRKLGIDSPFTISPLKFLHQPLHPSIIEILRLQNRNKNQFWIERMKIIFSRISVALHRNSENILFVQFSCIVGAVVTSTSVTFWKCRHQ